jgi:hypothetical protein
VFSVFGMNFEKKQKTCVKVKNLIDFKLSKGFNDEIRVGKK